MPLPKFLPLRKARHQQEKYISNDKLSLDGPRTVRRGVDKAPHQANIAANTKQIKGDCGSLQIQTTLDAAGFTVDMRRRIGRQNRRLLLRIFGCLDTYMLGWPREYLHAGWSPGCARAVEPCVRCSSVEVTRLFVPA